MKTKLLIAVLFFSTLLISCEDTQNEILEMRVGPHKQIGYGFIGPRTSYVVQIEDEIGDEDWSSAFGITDFNYEWGYTYEIVVAKEYFDEPVMDAPSFRYIFLKELKKERVTTGTRFELILEVMYDDGYVENFWEGSKESGYNIVGNKSFDCADLCDELTKERGEYTLLKGTFEHTGNGMIRLVDLKTQDI